MHNFSDSEKKSRRKNPFRFNSVGAGNKLKVAHPLRNDGFAKTRFLFVYYSSNANKSTAGTNVIFSAFLSPLKA